MKCLAFSGVLADEEEIQDSGLFYDIIAITDHDISHDQALLRGRTLLGQAVGDALPLL